jgi:hypothetical protein
VVSGRAWALIAGGGGLTDFSRARHIVYQARNIALWYTIFASRIRQVHLASEAGAAKALMDAGGGKHLYEHVDIDEAVLLHVRVQHAHTRRHTLHRPREN